MRRRSKEPPPSRKPGTISVVPPPDNPSVAGIGSDVGVEVILDTSGSMLQRAGGRRRIDIAKDVLRDLVARGLPAGTPLALRVLGSRSDPCGTELAVPLQPLDAGAVTALVDAIEVVEEADTPLGAAIASVPDDLAGSEGTRILLVVTDSRRSGPIPTCAAWTRPRPSGTCAVEGIDARLNIVGFGLTNKRAKSQLRRWARLGNGSTSTPREGSSSRERSDKPFPPRFGSTMRQATRWPAGRSVGCLSRCCGTYSVVVLTDPVARFDGVGQARRQCRAVVGHAGATCA